ncbi:MAG: hypothetical protein ACFBSE_23005 [Prochloraceae cyanobacterium]
MRIDRILHQRLTAIEKNLELNYRKLAAFERKRDKTDSPGTEFEMEEDIKIIRDRIRTYEIQYWEIYPTEAIDISEEEAKSELARIEEAVISIENVPSTDYPSEELIILLQDIKAKLDDLDNKTAAAKLKLVLPLIPAIASYELEMNPNGLMPKIWKKIRQTILRDTIKK